MLCVIDFDLALRCVMTLLSKIIHQILVMEKMLLVSKVKYFFIVGFEQSPGLCIYYATIHLYLSYAYS